MFEKFRFYFLVWSLMRSQYYPRKRLDALAQRRLRSICLSAARIPLWQELYAAANFDPTHSSMEAFAWLPITSKKNFLGKAVDTYTDSALLGESFTDQTSGSTGEPFTMYHDLRYEFMRNVVRERSYRTIGLGKRYPLVLVRPSERRGFAYNKYVSFLVRDSKTLADRLPELVSLLGQYPQGVILFSLGSWIFELAKLCQERGIVLPLRGAVPSGENLSPEQRAFITEALGTKLWSFYGMAEMGNMAFTCEQGRLHVHEEWVYIEIMDETGRPLPLGERGRIVITCFENRVMPFIRYDSGDIGVLSAEPCPCGRTLRTIVLEGRRAHILPLPDGTSASVTRILNTLSLFTDYIRQHQIIWHGGYSFTIKIIPGPLYTAAARDSMTRRLVETTHPAAVFAWETVESIPGRPNGKAVYFIDASQPNDASRL